MHAHLVFTIGLRKGVKLDERVLRVISPILGKLR